MNGGKNVKSRIPSVSTHLWLRTVKNGQIWQNRALEKGIRKTVFQYPNPFRFSELLSRGADPDVYLSGRPSECHSDAQYV